MAAANKGIHQASFEDFGAIGGVLSFRQTPGLTFRFVGIVDGVEDDAARDDLPFAILKVSGGSIHGVSIETVQATIHHAGPGRAVKIAGGVYLLELLVDAKHGVLRQEPTSEGFPVLAEFLADP